MFLAILPIPFGSKFKYFTVEIRIIISKLWRMNEWNRNYSNVIFSLLFPSSLSDHSVSPTLCTSVFFSLSDLEALKFQFECKREKNVFFRDLAFFSFSFFQRRKRKKSNYFCNIFMLELREKLLDAQRCFSRFVIGPWFLIVVRNLV